MLVSVHRSLGIRIPTWGMEGVSIDKLFWNKFSSRTKLILDNNGYHGEREMQK